MIPRLINDNLRHAVPRATGDRVVEPADARPVRGADHGGVGVAENVEFELAGQTSENPRGCHMPRLVLASVCFLVVVSIAAGDGLLFQMPNDGEYVRFTIQFRIKRDGMEIPGTGLFTMSSVGRETVKGSPCRWIEVKSVEKVKAQETTAIVKMLIPEKVLVSDKDPLDHVVRGWMKRSIREDGEETDLGISEANNPKSGFAGPIQIYLSGPLEDVKTLEAETIETKLGKLECKVRTGKKDIAFGSREISIQFTNWLHHRPPFGLAKARLFVKERTGTMEVVYELLESGKDAKSEIPDKN